MQAFNTANEMGMPHGMMQNPFAAAMPMPPGMDMNMQTLLHAQQQMQPNMMAQYGGHMQQPGMMGGMGMYGDGEEGLAYEDYDALALQMQQLQLQQQLQMQLQQHDMQGMMPAYQQVWIPTPPPPVFLSIHGWRHGSCLLSTFPPFYYAWKPWVSHGLVCIRDVFYASRTHFCYCF